MRRRSTGCRAYLRGLVVTKMAKDIEMVAVPSPNEGAPNLRSDRDDPVVRAEIRRLTERGQQGALVLLAALGCSARIAMIVAGGDLVENVEEDAAHRAPASPERSNE